MKEHTHSPTRLNLFVHALFVSKLIKYTRCSKIVNYWVSRNQTVQKSTFLKAFLPPCHDARRAPTSKKATIIPDPRSLVTPSKCHIIVCTEHFQTEVETRVFGEHHHGAVKPGPHQQQCRSNIVECYNVECCFHIVAVFGNNVEATFDFVAKKATMSNEFCVEISYFWQSRTLLRHCCPKRQHCRTTMRCFGIVARVDRA